jgi:peptidoglycan/xylan/chitin deacetylase (PgdA/CDA1 family)
MIAIISALFVAGVVFGLTPTAHAVFAPISNPSLEEGIAGRIPFDWRQATYGENSPTFEYILDDGHASQKSIKVTVSDYVSGDAKWLYTPQTVESGTDYLFSAWYKTNTVPHVVAQYSHKDGRISYFGMPRPEPNGSDWQEYKSEFSVPTDVTAVSIFFYLAENGWVQTDDYSITPYEYIGFDRPLVSITFDDGAEENTETALPILEKFSLVSTQCYTTSHVEADRNQAEKVLAFVDTGHEICSHTVTHPNLTILTDEELTYELAHPRAYLEEVTSAAVRNFASPYGAYDSAVVEEIKKYYYSHRTVNEGFNSKNNLDPYRLKSQNMHDDTTLEEFKEWVNKAIEEKLWLVLVYHKVSDENVRQYDTYTNDFAAQMEWLASTGVVVSSLDEALEEVVPQTDIVYAPKVLPTAHVEKPADRRPFFMSLLSALRDTLLSLVTWSK